MTQTPSQYFNSHSIKVVHVTILLLTQKYDFLKHIAHIYIYTTNQIIATYTTNISDKLAYIINTDVPLEAWAYFEDL